MKLSEDLVYVGASDRTLSLFENTFPVPWGMSYNSYLLLDEKTVLFDTADRAVQDVFLENVAHALGGRRLDYLVVQHMEPDHSAVLCRVAERYPEVTVLCSAKAEQMIGNFFPAHALRIRAVKEGETLETGRHSLTFLSAPMVHWPEVIFTFDRTDGVLFSADAFGSFGALDGLFDGEADLSRLASEERRYYFNIVGKYGAQVKAVLKKAAGLEIKLICPLHGPVRRDVARILGLYGLWADYLAEERGALLVYGTVHGHTAAAAERLAAAIAAGGAPVKLYDVSHAERSHLLAEAFRYSHLVLVCATYNNGIFVRMEDFLHDLGAHNFHGRRYALAENGSWAPQAGRLMRELLGSWAGMEQLGETVTVLSSMKEEDARKLDALGALVAADVNGGSYGETR